MERGWGSGEGVAEKGSRVLGREFVFIIRISREGNGRVD